MTAGTGLEAASRARTVQRWSDDGNLTVGTGLEVASLVRNLSPDFDEPGDGQSGRARRGRFARNVARMLREKKDRKFTFWRFFERSIRGLGAAKNAAIF